MHLINITIFFFIPRLWGNKIGDAGAEALAQVLESSNTLVWLR